MSQAVLEIKKGPFDWPMIIGLVVIHLIAIAGVWCFTPSGLLIAAVLYWISGPLGICIGYHRFLTHPGFKTYSWFKYVLTVCGLLAWQGSPLTWAGTHRIHHQHSDKTGDPHSPRHGFSWSHMFWIWRKPPDNLRELVVEDLRRDKGILWLSQYYPLPQMFLALVLALTGYGYGGPELALSWVVWGIGVRTVVVYHVTWMINSVCHVWGQQHPDSTDDSRNVWWLSPLTFGENWHNNHHRDRNSAAHGWYWWQFDLNYLTICLFWCFGLAWDIKTPGRKLT